MTKKVTLPISLEQEHAESMVTRRFSSQTNPPQTVLVVLQVPSSLERSQFTPKHSFSETTVFSTKSDSQMVVLSCRTSSHLSQVTIQEFALLKVSIHLYLQALPLGPTQVSTEKQRFQKKNSSVNLNRLAKITPFSHKKNVDSIKATYPLEPHVMSTSMQMKVTHVKCPRAHLAQTAKR